MVANYISLVAIDSESIEKGLIRSLIMLSLSKSLGAHNSNISPKKIILQGIFIVTSLSLHFMILC